MSPPSADPQSSARLAAEHAIRIASIASLKETERTSPLSIPSSLSITTAAGGASQKKEAMIAAQLPTSPLPQMPQGGQDSDKGGKGGLAGIAGDQQSVQQVRQRLCYMSYKSRPLFQ